MFKRISEPMECPHLPISKMGQRKWPVSYTHLSLVTNLGKKGYTAVDKENQINMTEYEKVIEFCEKIETKQNGRLTIVEVARDESCIIRNMETRGGNVNMIRSYYIYENGKWKQSSEDLSLIHI